MHHYTFNPFVLVHGEFTHKSEKSEVLYYGCGKTRTPNK